MPDTVTDNHSLIKPAVGSETGSDDENWGEEWNQNAESLDETLVIVDSATNKTQYTPVADQLYFAIDTQQWYHGTGTAFVPLGATGESPTFQEVIVNDILTVSGARALTTADEGSGNGLNADTVDGLDASELGGSGGGSGSQRSDESIQDVVGGMVTGSGATTTTYDDASNTLTIDSTDTDTDTNTQAVNPVTSGSVQLANGIATISTGVTEPVSVYLDPSNGGAASANIDVVASARYDSTAGEILVEIEEDSTTVGNPTVGYKIFRGS